MGSWIAGGAAALLLVLSVLSVVVGVSQSVQGSVSAGSSFGVALIILSLAVMLAAPLGIRWSIRRGLLVATSAVATVLFLGTCGGGIALTAAFPPASPTPAVASRIVETSPPQPASPAHSPSPSPTPSPYAAPSPKLSPSPSAIQSLPPVATPSPTPPPPLSPAPPANDCGAPANPWGYNFCGRGAVIYSPPSNFCQYFNCIPSFWKSTSGYVDECQDGTYSHSGGRQGACSYHRGELRALYSGP
jgi:hypothetical protein